MSDKFFLDRQQHLGVKRNFKTFVFLMTIPLYLYHSLASKDYWAILFVACLALYAPILWGACALYLCYKTITQYKHVDILRLENIHSSIVFFVEQNHLSKLAEAIESNPEILYCEYQRRSLIAWCRYYKNTNAQELVVQMMKKYPKEAIAA